jgi:hypothetical protein
MVRGCPWAPIAPRKMAQFRVLHKRDRDAQRKAGIKSEAFEEESFGPNWLEKADWSTYYQQVVEGMKESRCDIGGFHRVLDAAAQLLSLPWKTSYFEDPQRRRVVGGVKPYGAMGHVFASGGFAHLVRHRTRSWGALVSAVNQIAKLNRPIKCKSRLPRAVPCALKCWTFTRPPYESDGQEQRESSPSHSPPNIYKSEGPESRLPSCPHSGHVRIPRTMDNA